MADRTASCGACGALTITARGAPLKVSACHCRSCQRRTGGPFGVAVFFSEDQVTPHGHSQSYVREGDSGQPVEFHFCPACGSSVYWRPAFRPGRIAVAYGCFGEDAPGGPSQAVYEDTRHPWARIDLTEG